MSQARAVTATFDPASALQFGLEWDGTGSVRRMLYWNLPPPIYPMTYLFRVLPHQKHAPASEPTGYYTTFFWGNNGTFTWKGGGANTYYGMHPYPAGGAGAPNGEGQWEISVHSIDPTTGVPVSWDRWHVQAIRVRRINSTTTEHEFYYDWDLLNPPTSCAAPRCLSQTVSDSGWATSNPPNPAIVMGQAPDLCGLPPCQSGFSWGGYPGWEEFKGVIRGIQIYTNYLSLTDIQAELTTPKSSTAGAAAIWYLNVDPRPSDVTDKKATGTPNTPAWAGTTATEWTSGTISPPAAPSSLRLGP